MSRAGKVALCGFCLFDTRPSPTIAKDAERSVPRAGGELEGSPIFMLLCSLPPSFFVLLFSALLFFPLPV